MIGKNKVASPRIIVLKITFLLTVFYEKTLSFLNLQASPVLGGQTCLLPVVIKDSVQNENFFSIFRKKKVKVFNTDLYCVQQRDGTSVSLGFIFLSLSTFT